MLCWPSLEVTPEMFNWVYVRRVCRPYNSLKILLLQPFLHLPTGVLGVIILLKHDVRKVEMIILQGIQQLIHQNLKVQIAIHPTINIGSISHSLPSDTLPQIHKTSLKYNSSLNQTTHKHAHGDHLWEPCLVLVGANVICIPGYVSVPGSRDLG